MAKMAAIHADSNPLNEFVWNRKYKFFSNPVMKHTHGTYAKAQNDPLKGETSKWEDSFTLPEHNWVQRQQAADARPPSRPPSDAPVRPSIPKNAAPPMLQPSASDEALAKTLESVNK